ncbi:universal stress protein in QAH/OAS sulfhydrylase 3'region-like isoform X1 [Mytilus edulis]|uniref:universal stress protein in QAH/OAS sulfhydrylase 3'region-like isoform X1 n=1 Tax=Mytilus edulis TaxID=6550 RepID=UPI0039F0245D
MAMMDSLAVERRIVVIAVDDSDHSEFAFNFYLTEIKKNGDILILVYVPEYHKVVQAPVLLTDPGTVSQLIKEEEQHTCKLVKRYSDRMQAVGLTGKMKQMSGKPGEAIIEAAIEENADMIVVGTRGLGKVKRTFLGSVSDYCVHHSPVPVLVCKRDHHKHDKHHKHHKNDEHTDDEQPDDNIGDIH